MVVTVIALISGVYFISTNFLLASYRNIETREMNRNVNRVLDAYHQREAILAEKCK